jgi:Protein of unknown function (DUF2510)
VTNPQAPRTPAGWYPDPDGVQRQCWWDGEKWTADVAPLSEPQPYSVDRQQLSAPPGTDWNTPWIWLLLFLLPLPSLSLFFLDWSQAFEIDPVTMRPDLDRQLAFFTSPAYLFALIGGLLSWALSLVLSYLDFKTLRDRGVPSPFHWAWSFLNPYVYAIGRGVVTNRRIGKGLAVVWVAVGILVLGLILGFVLAAMIFGAVFSQLPELSELPTS